MENTIVPQSPWGLPLIGDSIVYLRDPMAYLLRARRRHGELVRMPLGMLSRSW